MPQATATVRRATCDYLDASAIYVVRLDADVSGLPALVMKMIELFDGTRTVEQVAEQAQISVSKASAVVRKLARMEILRTPACELPTKTRKSRIGAAFSAEEEAFFAAELEPIDECDEPFAPPLGERVSLAVSELILRLKGSPAI